MNKHKESSKKQYFQTYQSNNMKLLKALSVIFILVNCVYLPNIYAKASMRRCMLLPIRDSIDGAIGFKVFEQVEYYLKESSWCYYKSNSEIINILGNYKKDLDEHLSNKEVLRVLSEKTKAGSLIKVKIVNQLKGVEVGIIIIGANGEDIYFREKTQLNTDEYSVISQTIKNWLDMYEKTIPYNARILGILGNQITFDLGKRSGLLPGREIEIKRPVKQKRHPLLKEIVDWDTEKIGEAKVFHVTEGQSQGKVFKYEGRKRLKLEDWIILKPRDPRTISEKDDLKYTQDTEYDFGKLGTIGFFGDLGKSSVSYTEDGTDLKKIGGTTFGVELEAEVWATRNYWGGLEIAKKLGSYKQQEGTISASSNSVTNSVTKLKLGYRYLPLGFFYGPRVDGYIGYANYGYGLDNQQSDGFGEVTFKGLVLGTRGSIPIMRMVRMYLEFDFMLKPGYEEEITIYGDADSTSNYHIEIGASYKYSPNMDLQAGMNFVSNKAKFTGPKRTLAHKETSLKFGAVFAF
jgi:hypothetical protein